MGTLNRATNEFAKSFRCVAPPSGTLAARCGSWREDHVADAFLAQERHAEATDAEAARCPSLVRGQSHSVRRWMVREFLTNESF